MHASTIRLGVPGCDMGSSVGRPSPNCRLAEAPPSGGSGSTLVHLGRRPAHGGGTGSSRTIGERFVEPATARVLDASSEGMIMHKVLPTHTVSRDHSRATVVRFLGLEF